MAFRNSAIGGGVMNSKEVSDLEDSSAERIS